MHKFKALFRSAGLLALVVWLTLPLWIVDVVVPFWVVNHVPERIKRLQPGMTETQVWATLGLLPYKRQIARDGSGPGKDYREGFRLGLRRGLLLVFDRRQNPPIFKRAQLVGKGW